MRKIYYVIYDMDADEYRICFRYDDLDVDPELMTIDTNIGGIKVKDTAKLIRDALNAFTPKTTSSK